MKAMFVADIHGNLEAFKKVMDFYKREEIDKLIILGDTFSGFFSPTQDSRMIASLLFDAMPNLLMIAGNNDTEAHYALTPLGMKKSDEIVINKHRVFCHHGHKRLPYTNALVVASGHTHVNRLEKIDGTIYLNPGSVGLPRDNTNGSFAVMTKYGITIFDLDYNVIKEHYFNM